MSRKLIRNKVYCLLKDNTSFEGRIFRTRKIPLQKDGECSEGVILVYLEKESSSIFNDSPRHYKRTLTLSIAIVKSLGEEDEERIEDQLETVSLEIEAIMGKHDDLDGLASDVTFEGYEFIDNEEGEFKEGAVKLTYSIVYYIETGLDDSDLEDLEKSHVEIMNGEHSDFQLDLIHPTE